MRLRLALAATLLLSLAALSAHAQKNEFAVEGSGLFNTSAYNPGVGGGFQLNYAHRMFGVPGIGLDFEVPFVAGFNNSQYIVTQLRRADYNNYYVTPGLKVKFVPALFVSPFLAAGVGWAHFSSTQSSASDTTFAADWGGGLDFKLIPLIGLRVEARDFYSGGPSLIPFAGSLGLGNQNNVVVSGGIVLRF